jgi:hypothetical protein
MPNMMLRGRTLLKFGPPAYLLLVPIMALYGWLSPWPVAEAELTSSAGQVSVLVGASYRKRVTSDETTESRSRTYVSLPSALLEPKTVTIEQVNDGMPVVSESRFGALFMLVWMLACGFGTWWFWFRGKSSDAT